MADSLEGFWEESDGFTGRSLDAVAPDHRAAFYGTTSIQDARAGDTVLLDSHQDSAAILLPAVGKLKRAEVRQAREVRCALERVFDLRRARALANDRANDLDNGAEHRTKIEREAEVALLAPLVPRDDVYTTIRLLLGPRARYDASYVGIPITVDTTINLFRRSRRQIAIASP